MKKASLNITEKKIVSDYENSQLLPVADWQAEKKKYEQLAKLSINKTKNVNIRLTEKDWYQIKAKAIENGLPYQTLMAMILRKYLNGQIKAEI